jgi:hypothetical protein
MSPKELRLVPSDTFLAAHKQLSDFIRNSRYQTSQKLISPPQTIGMAFASLPIGILVAEKGKPKWTDRKTRLPPTSIF